MKHSKFNLSKETKVVMSTILDKNKRDDYKRIMIAAEKTFFEMKNRKVRSKDVAQTED